MQLQEIAMEHRPASLSSRHVAVVIPGGIEVPWLRYLVVVAAYVSELSQSQLKTNIEDGEP